MSNDANTVPAMWRRIAAAVAHGARWVWHGIGWPAVIGAVVIGVCGWIATGGHMTAAQITAVAYAVISWHLGFYSGRIAEQLWLRRTGFDRAGPVDAAERAAMFQVWRDAQYVADELADKAKYMLAAHDRRTVTLVDERLAASQLRAAVVLHDSAREYRERQLAELAKLQTAADDVRRARGNA